MLNETIHAPNAALIPTRRLTTKERAVFERLTQEFNHLSSSDAEQLTQYAEAVIRYQIAAKETKKNPTVSIPVVNRSTGNTTGHKVVRNPAFVTLREASAQMISLGRRLLIDAHSAEKRLRMASKLARSAAAVAANSSDYEANLTEEQIETKMRELAISYTQATPETLRYEAILDLVESRPGRFDNNDTDISYLGLDGVLPDPA
jgi:phage terminase small subunit